MPRSKPTTEEAAATSTSQRQRVLQGAQDAKDAKKVSKQKDAKPLEPAPQTGSRKQPAPGTSGVQRFAIRPLPGR